MKRLSGGLVLVGQLMLVPLATAADSWSEAFVNGAANGQVAAYGTTTKEKGGEREGFISGSVALAYRTVPFYRLSLGFGAWATTRMAQENDGDYRAEIGSDAIIHQAYLHYAGEGWGEITAGRHEIDLEWLNDYILGGSAQITPLNNLELTLGWAGRQAVVDLDEVGAGFSRLNDNKGLYFIDLQYAPLEWLTVNPYYYHAPDLFRAPGLKLTSAYEIMENLKASTTLQFVKSATDSASGEENGDLFWLEQTFARGDFGFGGGYLKANSKGVGLVDSFGDQSPFEEGNRIYEADAKTWYLELAYEGKALSLTALYGQTHYYDGTGKPKEKELNLVAGYGLYENLDLELIYADVRNNVESDYYTFSQALVYSF
ncbi:MAG TPA: hypothetical protein ENN98_04165 [Desulfurivibrio alkaliphilus]|uniref:Porin n=1 Tax=Desulfurivibrio alkaliphilus TaxID=427923 RepID=A0A7C2XZ80_9BACT|nr:hypothetical protein [Desulfurivibrio alkaliphilus]